MPTIKRITENKKQFLDLLLLADEQESMIDKYLPQGDLFALSDTDLKTVCVVLPIDHETCELKNIATYVHAQGKGYATAMIGHISGHYRERGFRSMLVGTGDVPSILDFYQGRGFVLSHWVKNFFTNMYDHPIFEGEIQLVDMVYLAKAL